MSVARCVMPGLLVALAMLLAAARVDAATFVVDSVADAPDAAPGNGVCATAAATCTLRAAIMEANAVNDPDTVTLPPGTYTLAIAGAAEDAGATGDLDVTRRLTIAGAGAATTILDGGGIDRVLDVHYATVTMSEVTIRGGAVSDCGGGVRSSSFALALSDSIVTGNTAGQGGGLCNEAPVHALTAMTLDDVTVEANTAATTGGGIATVTNFVVDFVTFGSTAITTMTDAVIAENQAGWGGGVSVFATFASEAELHSTTSVIRDNQATTRGGGVYLVDGGMPGFPLPAVALFHALETTIADNTAAEGGGIYGGTFDLERSSVHGNEATSGGGGIFGLGTITDGTVSGNRTDGDGGGILVRPWYSCTLRGVTVSANVADADDNGSGDGGGISTVAPATPGYVRPLVDAKNVIVAGNLDAGAEAPDCAGELRSSGQNLVGTTTGCLIGGDATGNVLGIDAGIAPLAANGGPTLTHALLPGSPALDAGAGCSATDQRGVARPHGPSCDMGAVEQAYVGTACGNGSLDGGEACDDGNVRDGDCCDHLCQLDVAGTDCADGNACTDETCDGAGACVPTANAAPCSDGSVCTAGSEVCAGGDCASGTPVVCDDDGDQCTDDACHPVNGCTHPRLTGTPCDDGNVCTDADTCDHGNCKGTHNTAPCNDGNACTDPDACLGGGCSGTPTTNPCDDGNACTLDDHCGGGWCQPGAPLFCTAVCQSCDSSVGCVIAPRTDCRVPDEPDGASVQIDDKDNPKSDSLRWSWRSKGATPPGEISAGSVYPDYEICIFDETAGVPELAWGGRPRLGSCIGTGPCWTSSGGGPAYKDKTASGEGITSLKLRAKPTSVKLSLKAKGVNFAVPPLPFAKDPGVVVELRRRFGTCWSSRFENPKTDTLERFKAKSE